MKKENSGTQKGVSIKIIDLDDLFKNGEIITEKVTAAIKSFDLPKDYAKEMTFILGPGCRQGEEVQATLRNTLSTLKIPHDSVMSHSTLASQTSQKTWDEKTCYRLFKDYSKVPTTHMILVTSNALELSRLICNSYNRKVVKTDHAWEISLPTLTLQPVYAN